MKKTIALKEYKLKLDFLIMILGGKNRLDKPCRNIIQSQITGINLTNYIKKLHMALQSKTSCNISDHN